MKKLLLVLIPAALVSSACPAGKKCGNKKVEAPEQCDDGNQTPGDGCENDCTLTPRCGDGKVEAGEQCDDGNQTPGDGCENNCTKTPMGPVCGNGILEAGEDCDDGNKVSGDGCENNCTRSPCGNGVLDPGEQCDDGNNVDGDGCEHDCKTGYCGNHIVDPGEQCDDGNLTDGDGCEHDCTRTNGVVCGDGTKEGAEQCDDGNTVDGDGCEHDCTLPFCGNGIKDMGEQCDDGNTVNGDGCEADCTNPRCGNGIKDPGEQCDDGNMVSGDGCENDCTATPMVCGNGVLDTGEQCDDGNKISGDGCEPNCTFTVSDGGVIVCAGTPPPPPPTGTCSVTPGDGRKLITGVLLTPNGVVQNGQVLVGTDGTLACVGCNCDALFDGGTASRLDCVAGVISPGLINTHDHISYQAGPYDAGAVGHDPTERYEHRHDWRVGGAAHDGHTKISSGSSATNAQIRWAELRQVMSGETSIVGATYGTNGNQGMLRNLDSAPTAGQLGLGLGAKGDNSETFPLSDTAGVELVNGCAYPGIDLPSVIPTDAAYLPHISEGIEDSAHNEFRCTAALQAGGQNLLGPYTSIVHGIALKPSDVALMAANKTSLVWSPRSNVSLYGDTASIPMYQRMGINVSLGMDWVISGSMNMLRELKCAQSMSTQHFNGQLSDQNLWQLVTANAADATGAGNKIGRLKTGFVADLAIYRQSGALTYGSVVAAQSADVVLTMRGGKILYGDLPLVNAFDTAMTCEQDNICGVDKGFCVKDEYTTDASTTQPARDLAGLKTANAGKYPLYYCATPDQEPTCDPRRYARDIKDGSGVFPDSMNDADGDGVDDSVDNCPNVFNPIRPMHHGVQADADHDGVGDACDPCPLDANATVCGAFTSGDIDRDTIPDSSDNCPEDPNTSQTDSDGDGIGDVCDWCPAPNANGAGCPVTIYDVRSSNKYRGDHISLGNVLVTVVTPVGVYVQVHESETGYTGRDNSGLFVYGAAGVNVGDRINITDAVPSIFQGEIELTQVTGVTVASSGNPLPAPEPIANLSDIATGGPRAASLEGVLVSISTLNVTDDNPPPGAGDTVPTYEFVVNGSVRVDDLLYRLPQQPVIGETFPNIVGLLVFKTGNSKLEPRAVTDYTFGPPVLAALEPALSYMRESTQGTSFPSPLQVRLSRTWTSDLAINVTSGPEITVADAGTIVVPAGQLTALVPMTAGSPNDAGTPLSATLLTTRNAVVRVVGNAEVPRLVSLTPSVSDILPGGGVTFTVGFDIPPTADTPVSLTLTPPAFGTVPASATVLANTVSASFVVTADVMAMGQATVSATLGSDTFNSTLNLRSTTTNHVVISEVAPQGFASDAGTVANDEFVELYNPTPSPVDIGGWELQYKSATGATWSNKAAIPGQTVMPPHSFYLIASKSFSGAGTIRPDLPLTTDLQLAAASGHVRIGLPGISTAKVDPLEVDRLGYGTTADYSEGGGHTANLPTAAATFERKANPASTSASMSDGGVDMLQGNGLDTDNNADQTLADGGFLPGDFVIRGYRDPQNATFTEP